VREVEGEIEVDVGCICDFGFGEERVGSATDGVFGCALGPAVLPSGRTRG
jgi:hypothetical protein